MRRKRKNTNNPVKPDRKFNSLVVSLLTNKVMKDGKKAKAVNIVNQAATVVEDSLKLEFLSALEQALTNVKPSLETKSRKFGGSNQRVPVKVEEKRALTLALRWLVEGARAKGGSSMVNRLSQEIIDAYNSRGAAFKFLDK